MRRLTGKRNYLRGMIKLRSYKNRTYKKCLALNEPDMRLY